MRERTNIEAANALFARGQFRFGFPCITILPDGMLVLGPELLVQPSGAAPQYRYESQCDYYNCDDNH
jgi:hypothetical protein